MNKYSDETKDFIRHLHFLISFWDKQKQNSQKENLEGLIHSTLVFIDGCTNDHGYNIRPVIEDAKGESIEQESLDGLLHEAFYSLMPTKSE